MIAAELLAAAALDLCLGDPRRLPHPVVGIGQLIRFFEEQFFESPLPKRLAGGCVVAAVLLCTGLLTWLVLAASSALHPLVGSLMTVWLIYTTLAVRELHRQAALVVAAVAAGDLIEARSALSLIVGRETADLDEAGILRACLETVAENTADGIVAPLFYLALGGPIGGLLYKAVNTMDSMLGYRTERYHEFGWTAARLDDLCNWLPARLTALLMVLASFPLGLNGWAAWRMLWRDGRNHASPNAGYPEATAAGSLGVQLGGPARYSGVLVDKPTLGDADRPLTVALFRQMVYLMYAVTGLMLLLALAWLFLSA